MYEDLLLVVWTLVKILAILLPCILSDSLFSFLVFHFAILNSSTRF